MENKSDFKIAFKDHSLGHEDQKIELNDLANLTGFPKEFIQSELSLSSAREVSMKELRISMLHFLDTKLGEFK